MTEYSQDLGTLEMKLEILNLNYWENFKFANDLVKALGPTNTRYQNAQKTVNEMIVEINNLKKEIKKIKTH